MKAFFCSFSDDLAEMGVGLFLLLTFVISSALAHRVSAPPVTAKVEQKEPVMSSMAPIPTTKASPVDAKSNEPEKPSTP